MLHRLESIEASGYGVSQMGFHWFRLTLPAPSPQSRYLLEESRIAHIYHLSRVDLRPPATKPVTLIA
jgi:hypothetical protein